MLQRRNISEFVATLGALLRWRYWKRFIALEDPEITKAVTIPAGKSFFVMNPYVTDSGKVLKVWLYKPVEASRSARIVFVLHGADRNGEDYLDAWRRIADESQIIVVAPEFSIKHFSPFPEGYNLGNVESVFGFKSNRSHWLFSVIENVFDRLRHAGLTATSYSMFGHSAGGQFAHRMVLFFPSSRLDVAVAANAGWYTFPTMDLAYPYGLGDSVVGDTELREGLTRKLIVLLGEDDNDPKHRELLRSKEAMRQGAHRRERGTNFFMFAEGHAEKLGIKLNWERVVVPNVDHSYKEMSEAAVSYLCPIALTTNDTLE